MENPHDVVPYFENDGGFIRRVTKRDAYKQGHDSRDAEVADLEAALGANVTAVLAAAAVVTEKDARIEELVEALRDCMRELDQMRLSNKAQAAYMKGRNAEANGG